MSLHTLFAPRSIAVVGASTQPGSVGNDIAKNLLASDFAGEVYPVNPKTDTLLGVPCYKSVTAIPGSVDLAIIVVPAPIVPTVLREVGEKMIRAAVIISAGFKETGPEGAKLEKEIEHIATEHKITLLGPNCLGFIEPRLFLNASFASAIPQAGNIAFFSQSGALMSALLDTAKGSLGFSAFVSIGNKTMLDEAALLKHFESDAATEVLGFYSESLVNASALIETARSLLALKKPKPIVALKSGRTEAGTHASSSHTGAVAGDALAYAALFRQARILEAHSFEELLEYLNAASTNPLPQGKRLAIVTNAGGFGVLATDEAVAHGIELAPLSTETKDALRSILPPAASVANPVDVLGDALADRYADALSLVAKDQNVDMLLVIMTPQTMTEPEKTARVLVDFRKNYPHLPLVSVFAGHGLVQSGTKILERERVATAAFPESGARALAGLTQLGVWSREKKTPLCSSPFSTHPEHVREIFEKARTENTLALGSLASSDALRAYGFPFLESHFVTSGEEAERRAKKIGKPVALKIVSPQISHKSDVGGVLLHVAPEEAEAAYAYLMETVKRNAPAAELQGAEIVEMAETGGTELLLGLKKEPGLGTAVVFGLGGIFVETLKDVSLRFAPLSENDIDELMHEIKSFSLLAGARGQAGIDLDYLKSIIAQLSHLAIDFPEIEELDLNPLLAFPEKEKFRILDARIKLSEK